MTNIDACLYGVHERVRTTDGKEGIIAGVYRTGKRRYGGRRARWIWVQFDDGKGDYYRARYLRYAEPKAKRAMKDCPDGFYHFSWKD